MSYKLKNALIPDFTGLGNTEPVQEGNPEELIREFKKCMGGYDGQIMTSQEKIAEAQELLHLLRQDRKGKRLVSRQRSKDHRKYLVFVLRKAREGLSARKERPWQR